MDERRSEMHQIKEDIADLKEKVVKITELLEAWENAKGFVKVIEVMGKIAKALIPITAFCVALYYLITSGHWPKQ